MIDETEALKKNNQLDALNKINAFLSEKLTSWTIPEKWTILPELPPKEVKTNFSEKEINVDATIDLVNTFMGLSISDFKILLLGSIMQNLIMIIGKSILISDQTISGVAYIFIIIIVGLSVASLLVTIYALLFNKKLYSKPNFHHYRYASHLFLLGLLILSYSILPQVSIFMKVLVFRSLSLVPLAESRHQWASGVYSLLADFGLLLSAATAQGQTTAALALVAGWLLFALCGALGFVLHLGNDRKLKRGLELIGIIIESVLRQTGAYFHLGDLPKFTVSVDQDAQGNVRLHKKKNKQVNVREKAIAKIGFDEVASIHLGKLSQ